MWKRTLIWTDAGSVRGSTTRRIELLIGPDGKPVGYEVVTLWNGVPTRRVPSKAKPAPPNRLGGFVD